MPSTFADPATQRGRLLRHPAQLFISLGFLLILLWLGLKGWRLYRAVDSLQAAQPKIEALLADGVTALDPQEASMIIADMRRDVVTIRSETAVFMPFTRFFGWLPRYGPLLSAAPVLLEMADSGTAAAAYAFHGLEPGLALLQNGTSTESGIADMVQVLAAAETDLAQASLALEQVTAARASLDDTAQLPWRIRTLLEQMDEWLPIAGNGLKLAQVLPDIMGIVGPRRYLVIAQNEDELRPTGGFISGVGVIGVEDGRITEMQFQDAYKVDNWAEKPYEFPPQPLFDFMQLELFVFRDANYWPDFPTSAEKAMNLYSYGQDTPPLDGIIAIDQQFLQLLLEATGPVPIPGSEVTINSTNVIDNLRIAWALPEGQEVKDWIFNRKSFMSTFALAIKQRVESDFSSIDPIALVRNLHTAAATGHLQIYMRAPTIAAVLDQVNWDGRLEHSPDQDFLMVVDTNVGYNKTNLYVKQHISYHITLAENRPPQAQLSIIYNHTGPASGEPCGQGVSYQADVVDDYINLADKCYLNYLRVYVPAGSQLIDSTHHYVPGDAMLNKTPWSHTAELLNELPDFTTFANLLLVPRTEEITSRYLYALPPSLGETISSQQQYQLLVHKQPGARPTPLTILVQLPENTSFAGAVPDPAQVEEYAIKFEFILDEDIVLTVNYR